MSELQKYFKNKLYINYVKTDGVIRCYGSPTVVGIFLICLITLMHPRLIKVLIHEEHFNILKESTQFKIFKKHCGFTFFVNESCPYSTEHVLLLRGPASTLFNLICEIMVLERNNLTDEYIPYDPFFYNQGENNFGNYYCLANDPRFLNSINRNVSLNSQNN